MPRARSTAPALPDRDLWHAAIRDVAPLPGRAAPPPASTPEPVAAASAVEAAKSLAADRGSGIDRANAERLKRGRHAVEARLDLHGMTQAEAHRALIGFVRASYQAGRRCVLVITGRGLGPAGPGVLKGVVPRWLEAAELRGDILATAPAQPRHGGPGALYLLLRRRR
jgi:DNA-nicking Smr family endonuclease